MIKMYEDFIEKPENQIIKLFNELSKNINYWFNNDAGVFKSNNLIDLKRNNFENGTTGNLILTFDNNSNDSYTYIIIFQIGLDMFVDNIIDKIYIEIKKYDADMNLERSINENIPLQNLKSNYILDMISKMNDKSTSINNDNKNQLSDDDADLSDNIH